MQTLKGGREVTVTLETGETEVVIVRQFSLKQYDQALLIHEDEIALNGLACGKDKNWASSLSPESHEELVNIVREVNEKGFFPFAQRTYPKIVARLNSVKPEVLRAAIEKASQPLPPGLLPR
jgi:hypothetical protein